MWDYKLVETATPQIIVEWAILVAVTCVVVQIFAKVLRWAGFGLETGVRNRSTFQLVPVEEHYLQTLRHVNLNTTQENLDALRDFAIVQGERQAEAHNGHTDWQNDSFFNDVLQNTSFCNRINAQSVEFQQVGVVGEDVRSIASTISSVSRGGAGDCAGFETDCSDDSVMILAETPQKPMNTSEASVQCTEELPSTRVMTCPICWVDYIKIKSRPDPNKSQIVSITSCGHVLCRDCLKNAFPRRNYQLHCPVCSKPYQDGNVSQLFF